ncbi:hypothetical protein IGI04_042906 [Brassica rapa subsp. trilocularis]|uniref:Uncharacterized protein n=1 Tax=Brassica rapa subsp. trilocularis TaxID=1813537 RepID=A0ABQ7KJR3_BRACM|nr:hypothetical protein IGI04_042906 [Brassica rapa subsp. trilocularis]
MLVKKLRRIVGLCNQKSNWKTDATRPRPCKRENLKLGAKRSTGKFAGKVPGKFTGVNPAIDLNPALDSVGPNSPTLRTRTVRYTRTSVCVRQHTQDVRGRPSAHTGRPAVHQYTYQHAPWTVRVIFGPPWGAAVHVQHRHVRQHTQDVRAVRVLSVCPSVHTGTSAHTGRPSAHAGRPSAHAGRRGFRVCPYVRQYTQDVRQHTQDVSQYTQDVRQHTQDVRGRPSVHISACWPFLWTVRDVRQHTQDVRACPRVSVCPSVHQDFRGQYTAGLPQYTQERPWPSVTHAGRPWHVRCVSVCRPYTQGRPCIHTGRRPQKHTGRPSAHKGRPSSHAGRPWLSVCVRVSVSTHRTSVSTHRTSVSTHRTSVSTQRTSVAVRQYTQDVRGRPSVHTGRPWPSVSTHRTSVAVRQHTQDVRQCTQDVRGRPSAHTGCPSAHAGRPWLSVCVRVSVSTHRTSVSTHRTSVSTHRTSVAVRQYTQDVRGRPSVHISARWPFLWTVRVILAHVGCLFSKHRTSVSTRRTSVPVLQHTQTVRGLPISTYISMLTTHISMLVLPMDCPCTDFGQLMHHVSTQAHQYIYQHADHTYQHAGPSHGLSMY